MQVRSVGKRMVTDRAFGGCKPDGYEVRDARVWKDGMALDTPDEDSVFDLWGMCYVDPEDRT